MAKITANPSLTRNLTNLSKLTLDTPRLDNPDFFVALQKGKHDSAIVKELICTALNQLTYIDPKQQQIAASWLKCFIDIVQKNPPDFRKEIEILVGESAGILSRTLAGTDLSKLHSVPIWVTYTLNRDHYDQCILPKYRSNLPKNNSLNLCKSKINNFQRPLRELSMHLSHEITELQSRKKYIKDIHIKRDNRSILIDNKNYDKRNIDKYNGDIMHLTSLSIIYPLIDTDKSIDVVEKQKFLFLDAILESGLHNDDVLTRNYPGIQYDKESMVRYSLGRTVREQSVVQLMDSDNRKGVSLDSGSKLREFLKSSREHPEIHEVPYDIFLATCELYYKLYYAVLLNSQNIDCNPDNTPSLGVMHRNLIKGYPSYLSRSALILWYCLYVEFNILGGSNRDFHSKIRQAIEYSGMEDIFLDKNGNFLINYNSECLEKALLRQERNLKFNMDSESESDENSVEEVEESIFTLFEN